MGVDLVEIGRIDRVHQRFGQGFARRILAGSERTEFAEATDAVRFLAKRFAAKEAAAKALGTGVSGGIRFADLAVEHEPGGAPRLRLTGNARARAEELGASRSHLSLSDERGQVVACVILERV